MEIDKLYSDKFWEKNKDILIENSSNIIGLNTSKIVFYPFITGKGLQDIRKVFKQTQEEDKVLYDYYVKYWNRGTNLWNRSAKVAEAVNNRLTYEKDFVTYKKSEFWDNPINIHNKKKGDCDAYSVLLTYVLRLMGIRPNRVFTAVGYVNLSNNRKEYHAYTIVLDITKSKGFRFFPLEGSFYPNECMKNFLNKNEDLKNNKLYDKPDWITNDLLSYANTRWFKLIK